MIKKLITLLVILVIFAETFNTVFVLKPVLAKYDGNETIFGGDNVKAENHSEGYSQELAESENKWNFNDTNKWSQFAYVNDNKTRLIVGINTQDCGSYATLENIVARYNAKIVNVISIGGKGKAAVVELFLRNVPAFVKEVSTKNIARYIEPDMKIQALFVPNDPYWNLQWGPQKIGADWAWNRTMGSSNVLVAVVDTGIAYNHSDLTANYVPLGYDWVNNDTDPMDDHGHGTHCAGIIAAILNNSLGIAGLAQVRIMAEKVLTSGGWGAWDWVASGIIHAADCRANIISMSLGAYSDSELVHEAVKYAYNAGVLLIAAAGNDNTNTRSYPAAYDEVVAVAATDEYDDKAYFSNWGDWIELAAPGVDIYSTVPWGYESWSGTSMACPHVSGVAALIWSQYPNKTRDWVRLWLRYAADDLGDPGFDVDYGYGRINARKAVEQTPPSHELIAYKWETPPYVEPGASATINATLVNFGESNETNMIVQLFANGTIVDSTPIGFLPSGNSTTVALTWNPAAEGQYNITLYVVPVSGETSTENNVLWKYVCVGFPLKAFVLRSAGNVMDDIIVNWQTLNSEWYRFGGTMIYIDYTTLDKENITYEDIAAAGADVLIISCAYDAYAGWQFTDSEIEAIKRYVYEGHGLIATAGTFYSYVPNNNKLAPLFGLNETTQWDATTTDLLDLLNASHPLFWNVPNPFVFPSVGTSIPFDHTWGSSELAGGTYVAKGHFEESAVVTYRGLVYISPWLEVIPPYYHYHLQLLYNAITWSRYQKPEHELVVSLDAPKRLNPGESTLLNATVFNGGLNNETDVGLELFIDGALVDDVTVPELSVDSSCTLSYRWNQTAEDNYNITAYAPPVLGEEFAENNIAKKAVLILSIAVRNVLVYTDDYVLPPSSRYVIVALNNLGIGCTHCADDPAGFGRALISQSWDLVIVDHCSHYELEFFWPELEDYVRSGGFLIMSTFAIGSTSSATLWDALGVRWVSDMSSPEPVYRWVPSHSIFTFPNVVGDLTSYIKEYYDDGDHVAATTGTPIAGFAIQPADGYAGIVVGNKYPTVLFSFILDEFRFDQDSNGKVDAVKLWENAVVYLARSYDRDVAVLSVEPSANEVVAGETVNVTAVVANQGNFTENFTVTAYALFQGNSTTTASAASLNSTRIYLDPSEYIFSTSNASVGYRFNVTVRVGDVKDMALWQVRMYYNNNMINATRCFVPVWDSEYVFYGKATLPPLEYRGENFIMVGTNLFLLPPHQEPFNGDGKLCIIEFEIVAVPPRGKTYVCSLNISNENTYLTDGNITEIPASKEDGYYELSATLPLGSYVLGTLLVTGLAPGERLTLTFAWNTTWVTPADYAIYAEASIVPFERDTTDNICYDGVVRVKPIFAVHDVAVTDLIVSPNFAYQGWIVGVNVTVANLGNVSETFAVTLYYNATTVSSATVHGLEPNATLILSFHWNTTGIPCHCNYILTAAATVLPDETNTANNELTSTFRLKLLGDVDDNDIVDMRDVGIICQAFGATRQSPRWNPNCDMNNDGKIDLVDIVIACKNFQKSAG